MSELASALGSALRAAAADVARHAALTAPDLHRRLAALASPSAQARAASERAVQRAAQHLRRSAPDQRPAEALLTLLAAPGPAAAAFRQAAVGELLLSAAPNLGRLLDLYRRSLRPASDEGALAWVELAPLLRQFLGELLPQALASQHALRDMLPDHAARALLDTLRAEAGGTSASEELLDALAPAAPLQGIVASAGSHIQGVQQTIIHGDLYSAPAAPPPDLAALYQRYCAFLVETFGSLDFRGIMQVQHVMRLPLDAIYVEPSAQLSTHAPAVQRLHTIVRDAPLLVLLGDPGAGKSTLVRFVLLALAQAAGSERLGLATPWLPIFFPIAAFARARSAPGRRDLAPLDYLGDYYAGLSQPDYRPLFQRALAAGRALVLLDGLDEVRDDRLGMTYTLEAFVREWDAPGNRFIVTSRVAGYDEAPLDARLFAQAAILPFGDDEIRSFAARWSRAYQQVGVSTASAFLVPSDDSARLAELHAQDLCAAVFANPRISALARNPLLLTILALIHNQGTRLPDRRADLYRLCVEALAETWNRARSLSGHEVAVFLGEQKLDERFVVNLLGPAALWIHSHEPGGLVEQRDLERQLTSTLVQADGLPEGRARRLAQSFIELARRDTGLLQERGYRRFGFVHLTFEEYLAARGLLESVTVADADARIHAYCCDPRWHEVLRLMLAAAPQREAQRLLLHLLAAPTTPAQRGRPVVLAGECLLDIGRNAATKRAWAAVIDALVALLDDACVPLETRLAAGQVLGRLGDPRIPGGADAQPAASQVPAGYWCRIAAGPFCYGEAGEGAPAAAQRRIDLPYSFRIARFPVTNAEYHRFVAAGGYREPRWWTPEGRCFLAQSAERRAEVPSDAEYAAYSDSSGTAPGTDTLAIAQPALWGSLAFSSPAQPVVGVAWYEAAAYCAWLTDVGQRMGWLPPGDTLRLPTSPEWERAARHSDRRRFPWGDDAPDATRACYAEIGLRAPAPVGCFPAGEAACGARDMAGNVWEWTASLWERDADLMPRSDLAAAEMPVIRGGAFNWDASYLACGARYWFNPGHRRNLLGFRLVWATQS